MPGARWLVAVAVVLAAAVPLVVTAPLQGAAVQEGGLAGVASPRVACAFANGMVVGTHCMCPEATPDCTGSACVRGIRKDDTEDKDITIVQGFRLGCADCKCVPAATDGAARRDTAAEPTRPLAEPGSAAAAASNATKPRVLIMTVATHREPFIELLEQSVKALGHKLLVAGVGEFFKGYGWKLKKVLDVIEAHRDEYDLVLFSDSFDSFIFSGLDEVVAKFRSFHHPIVVSAEVSCWPNPHLAKFIPRDPAGRYPYPNSGGYIAELPYLLDLYSERIAINHKSDCTDDQGELIKAIALDNNAFRIDHNAVIFQTLFGDAKKDVFASNGRVVNRATGTKPCVVHANGWDKTPLLRLLQDAGHLSSEQITELLAEKASLEKKKTLQIRENDVNERCRGHNPNPSLEPERNLIREYGLSQAQSQLEKQLKANPAANWHDIEQQLFEVQEYRVHCPIIPMPKTVEEALLPRQCNEFKLYVYPLPAEQELKLPKIDREVRQILRESPYATDNPDEACLFVPSVPVSCWCEFCMKGAYANDVSNVPEPSQRMLELLEALPYWRRGRNHILFEFSDAPCITYPADYAVVASVGISRFHHREGLDVSLPLFSMVPYTDAERRVPPAERPFLLTFRGTRSSRSDAVRNQLPKIHNGRDILLLIACRWFGAPNAGRQGREGYDKDCAAQEEIFQEHTYSELAMGSKFSLIVEGFGYHSFRLTEAMAAGSIPVIAVDHYVLPFQGLLDWDQFSIRIPEWKLFELPEILRAIPAERVRQMQERVVFVFENFLRSLAFQVHTSIEQTRVNLFADNRTAATNALLAHGLPYRAELPERHLDTPEEVLHDSKRCNAPAHRQTAAKDGRSVML